jgi:hypothetical protein
MKPPRRSPCPWVEPEGASFAFYGVVALLRRRRWFLRLASSENELDLIAEFGRVCLKHPDWKYSVLSLHLAHGGLSYAENIGDVFLTFTGLLTQSA